MYRQLTLYKIAFLNTFLAALLLIWTDSWPNLLVKVFGVAVNIAILAIALRNLPKFIKHNEGRLLIGRKRTLIVCMSSVYIFIIALSIYYHISVRKLCGTYFAWTVLILIVHYFENPISSFLRSVIKRNRRIAVVGFDDNAHKLAEKLRKRNSNDFISHLSDENIIINPKGIESLSSYIDFAKKHHINEFYISVPEEEDKNITVLAEEAEKHCIRVNFITPQQNLESGFYHVHYIGGMPVLKRYKEPLRRLHKQIIKRSFDLFISSLVIILILSWLIPLVALLIKLESKGPVFFKQLRSGRDNNSFICLKFRSMHSNSLSDIAQTTKDDSRITRIGSFLRKTSLDEFPQFVNVFLGDMSIAGPRPHMLRHTEEYSESVNRYMVRLYLKPGVTGWAQVNGYRGEIKNIELMRKRVDHDIWYMENWSLLLDIKIMGLTLLNILKGDKNAY